MPVMAKIPYNPSSTCTRNEIIFEAEQRGGCHREFRHRQIYCRAVKYPCDSTLRGQRAKRGVNSPDSPRG
jgi:hypothetical protein